MNSSLIKGIGHYVPKNVITNFDLEKQMDTSNEWIVERTGINERRYFTPEEDTVSSMATNATKMALERANIPKEDVDMIILATITPDYYFPGSGVLMQRELGLNNIPCLDVRNACSGFIYALSVADQFIKTGQYKTIVVVGSEIQSSGLDFSTKGRNVSVIFGDGAGAVVLQGNKDTKKGILSTHLHSDGNFAEELCIKEPSGSKKPWLTHEMVDGDNTKPYMNGSLVFKHASIKFLEVIGEALTQNKKQKEELDLFIPHQANLRISQFVQKKLGLDDSKVFNNIMKYGNTTAASIPIAMSEAWEEGKIKEGDLVCLAAFGSGFSWGSALIQF